MTGSHLIFIHGAGSNAGFWYEQKAVFPDAHYLDLPGHSGPDWGAGTRHAGAHESTGSEHLIEAYAGWVEDYIRAANLGGIVLNGHSMGGAIVLTLALRHPVWLKGIVLTSTGARLPVRPGLIELLRADYAAAVGLLVSESFAPASGEPGYRLKALMNGARRQILRTPQRVTLGDYEACGSFDVTHMLENIDTPTLCIAGTEDKLTPPKYSEDLHRGIKGSQLEIIQGAGHMLPLEKPEEYNNRVLRFVGTRSIQTS